MASDAGGVGTAGLSTWGGTACISFLVRVTMPKASMKTAKGDCGLGQAMDWQCWTNFKRESTSQDTLRGIRRVFRAVLSCKFSRTGEEGSGFARAGVSRG